MQCSGERTGALSENELEALRDRIKKGRKPKRTESVITEGSVLEESRETGSETHGTRLAWGRRNADGVRVSIGQFMRMKTRKFMPDCHFILC